MNVPAALSPASPLDPPSCELILQRLSHPVLALGADGSVTYANAAAEASFGGWIIGLNIRDLFSGFAPAAADRGRSSPMILTTKEHVSFDARLAPLGEDSFVVDLRLANEGRETAIAADLDDLTGLAKRNMFMRHLAAALARGEGSAVAVHCLDLDRFKMINDTLGHGIGDLLLKKVADRLASACRKGDVVARLGGDEFVVLQHGVRETADAEKLAARIVDLVGRTYVLSGHTINIGVSVGVALQGDVTQARDLLRNGDLALYEAKRAGRGRYRLFETGMDDLLQRRRETEIDLRRALALKQFELNFQPFLDLSDDRCIGFEALLRWKHPVRGYIPPLEFISLAEENGLIVKIGEWVLRTACQEAATWPGEIIVAVNVSPIQFKADTLLDTVMSALKRSGLSAHRLEIEITEGALLDDTDNVLRTLAALRDIGVKISMDDFGTGYSSLSYLQKFPFNKIKIDRSFIANANADSEAILRAVAGLGASLGMAITAEGVETAEQLARIRDERCTHVQGYLTGRPMAAHLVADFLTRPDQDPKGDPR
ncbi:sensor domain-containing protein [Aureimonas phyllosphaerae]|uniref:Diguanylate cyclase (GGDEF)-like protein n=1 Tax=Aureimonas phyllosphaerae TaxID=1166078 RepID=A0A7W6BT95_9HYPH|nr:EAL domain-containing protein [Aureimonas phyllosphaerae]MBB3937598.1 diguanylate cyclase (GGDEF)-like protein [Aureimonas phyllosphaerae]MBB3961602.1 diguanylate cyclase (GGDEF)-like protein [Aureimonas phyllosphaerae]SFF46687.1 diguanylate cyclase (GGDEF) domain-containing protein [Aureimonas phyllosphaerae]